MSNGLFIAGTSRVREFPSLGLPAKARPNQWHMTADADFEHQSPEAVSRSRVEGSVTLSQRHSFLKR